MVNMIVVFGPTPESYVLGCGWWFVYQNIPPALAETITNKGLTVPDTAWISVTQNMDNWVAYNGTSAKMHYSISIEPKILENLGNAAFVSFGEPGDYLVRLGKAGWYGNMDNPTVLATITSLRQHMPGFDGLLEGVIIGNGKNHLYMLTKGFVFYLDENTEQKPGHPLVKIIRQFLSSGSWKVLPNSTLCPWDDRYFFLNFQEEGSTTIERRWNLPPEMAQKMEELRALAVTPEEQIALANDENIQAMLAITDANAAMFTANMLQQSRYEPALWY